MAPKSRRPARRPANKSSRRPTARRAKAVRRGATGARAANALSRRAARKAPKAAAKKAAKRAVKRVAKPARKAKVARKTTKKAVPKAPAKTAKRASPKTAPAKAPAKRAAAKSVVEFTETSRAARPLRIALFGASGNIGRRIAAEAACRGHAVTALVRHPEEMGGEPANVKVVKGDVTDPVQVEVAARSHDVVASAIAPPAGELRVLVDAAKSLLTAARQTGKRVVVVGGSGSLEVAPGVQLVDSPSFPAAWRPIALAHRDALRVFEDEGGEGWTVVSPAALIEPGPRTGRFRLGRDQLVADTSGNSRISMEDYAVAFVDELEQGRNLGKRFTVGY